MTGFTSFQPLLNMAFIEILRLRQAGARHTKDVCSTVANKSSSVAGECTPVGYRRTGLFLPLAAGPCPTARRGNRPATVSYAHPHIGRGHYLVCVLTDLPGAARCTPSPCSFACAAGQR